MMTNRKVPWSQIKEIFGGEWVELVRYEWEWDRPHPKWAVVRNHAGDRKELLSLIEEEGEVSGSVVLYIGHATSIVEIDSLRATL